MDPIQTQEPQTPDIRDYLRPIWRRRWLIVVVVFAATVLTYKHSSGTPKTYGAATTLYVQASPLAAALGTGTSSNPDRYVKDQSALITTPAIAQVAAQLLHFPGNPNALLAGTTATPDVGSDFIQISAISSTPAAAAAIANAFAQGFISLQSSQINQQARQALKADEQAVSGLTGADQLSMLQQIHQLQAIEAQPSSGITQTQPAYADGAPTSTSPKRSAAFAFFLSLVFCVGLAYALERLDRRLRRVEDLQRACGHPVVGEIFREAQPAPMRAGRPALPDQLREPFRALRRNIDLAGLDKPLKTILITSAVSGEGKSTVVRNLALAYREAGQRVAVIECDLRNPTLGRLLGVDPTVGVADLLTGRASIARALEQVPVYLPGLPVSASMQEGPDAADQLDSRSASDRLKLASTRKLAGSMAALDHGFNGDRATGFDDPGALAVVASGLGHHDDPAVLNGHKVRKILEAIAADYDVVLIDAPGLLSVSDAMPLVPAVDGMLIVSRLGKTTTQAARRLTNTIERIPGANVIGVVANGVPRSGRLYGES